MSPSKYYRKDIRRENIWSTPFGVVTVRTPALAGGIYENVYEISKVHNDFLKAMKVVRELYEYFLEKGVPNGLEGPGSQIIGDHREACDFVAGMTDRYALDLYQNIFLPKPWSVM